MSTYRTDFYQWTKDQVDALRRRDPTELDWENLSEEIESLGKRERREVAARLETLAFHLIQWRYKPELQCGVWRSSIHEARRRIEDVVRDNPSLRPYLGECLPQAYEYGRARALDETASLALPEECPWTIEQILVPDWLP